MIDATKRADTTQTCSDVAWDISGSYLCTNKDKELALKLLAAEGQACDALDRVAELEAKVSRLRGIIAEMVMYDWNGIATSPNAPPNSLREDVAEAIGFPVQPGAPSAGK